MIAATGSVDWKLLLAIAVVVVLGMILVFRLMNRDPDVRRTRYGFFVERDRYTDDEPFWPNLPPKPKHEALPSWPDRDKTVELPPEEEK